MPDGNAGLYSRGVRNQFTWVEHPPATLSLKLKAGIIYITRGPAKVELYPAAEAEMKSVAHVDIEPDKQEHEVQLHTTYRGLHRIEISDEAAGTSNTFSTPAPLTIVSSQDINMARHHILDVHFIVR